MKRMNAAYRLRVTALALAMLFGTAAEQQEQRLNDWHSAVERYPLQLHELERGEYLAMKRAEIRRQQTLSR